MQGIRDTDCLDDDMVDGDLGDGTGGRLAPTSNRKKNQTVAGSPGALLARVDLPRLSGQTGDAAWIPALNSALHQAADVQHGTPWKLPVNGSLVDLSKEELREKLQQAAEVVEVLNCELEVAHRYLEGKYEALRILQGKAILDKATTHTKSLLQKSEERAKALEKEVNSLQWELSFMQVQMKKCEQSWEDKHNRLLSDNKTLTDTMEERGKEIQQLRAENSALSQQCLELLSMLTVKEQRVFQSSKPQASLDREGSVVELAVLGACRCLGVAEPCPCSRTAAASRKQLIQLQRELDAQHGKREEAQMVADAFRIAFEQQLRKRSEHFLLLAEANLMKTQNCKPEGANWNSFISVNQKLKELLPSSFDIKMSDDLLGTVCRLLDLLNDKEEALAHQRKVSIMLAHSADELQKQLHQDSHCHQRSKRQTCQQSDPLETNIQAQVLLESNSQLVNPTEQHIQPRELSNQSQVNPQPLEVSNQSQAKTQPQELSNPSQANNQPQELSNPSLANTQPQELSNP
ncbi:coiled-coil domain-containing protein 125 [Genypterus blacodes]|uniref:coiled-coil domain-containing protein 125 n=1 Tax=Genypterus blacodes TaxID=154954 RepID=UPI003F76CA5F